MNIDKIYYSVSDELINIIVKDVDAGALTIQEYISDIEIYRVVDGTEEKYNASSYDMSYNSSIGILSIFISKDNISPVGQSGEDFVFEGVVSAKIIATDASESNISYFYNTDELYTYRLNMYKIMNSMEYDEKIMKDITRFIFLEEGVRIAAENGNIEDANDFYVGILKLYSIYKYKYV